MRRLFDINNPLMRFLIALFDLLALSVLWVVFSLPIVTLGAASTALYSAAFHHVRKGEDYLWSSFFTAFKENWKRSTLCFLVELIVVGLLLLEVWVMGGMIRQGYSFGWMYGVTLGLLVLALTWTVYVAAYTARFTGTVKEVLKFSLMLMRAHPVRMLGVVALVVSSLVFALGFPPAVVILPAAVYWGASFPIEAAFMKHLRPEDKARLEKEKYEE